MTFSRQISLLVNKGKEMSSTGKKSFHNWKNVDYSLKTACYAFILKSCKSPSAMPEWIIPGMLTWSDLSTSTWEPQDVEQKIRK